jgi:hypothetical protein
MFSAPRDKGCQSVREISVLPLPPPFFWRAEVQEVGMHGCMARARGVVVLLRNLERGLRFYGPEGLGLSVRITTEVMAELSTGGTPLILKEAPGEAECSAG